MNKTTEALKLAEEALESCNSGKWGMSFDEIDVERALAAIREVLAEPVKQEPVAYALSHLMGLEFGSKYPMQETKEAAEQMARQHMGAVVVTPLYAAPVSAEAIRAKALEEAAQWFEGNEDDVGYAIATEIRGLK